MENRHDVSILVTEPLATVEQRLRDVEAWAGFLLDVGQITKVSHERYSFRFGGDGRTRDVLVAVRHHPQQRCFVWSGLGSHSFTGTIRLADGPGGLTRVTVSMTRWPDGLMSGLRYVWLDQDATGIDEDGLRSLARSTPAGAATSGPAAPAAAVPGPVPSPSQD